MQKPVRIQRKRAKGWRMPPNTVYVGRGSEWGNSNVVGERMSNAEAVAKYEADIAKFRDDFPRSYAAWLEPLRGRNVACWCKESDLCHGDTLLRLANE